MSAEAITSKPVRRFRIVVALDLSEYSEIVLEHALDLASRYDAPDLHFVTVVEPKADLDEAKRELAKRVMFALDGYNRTDWRARLHVRAGRPEEEISNLAAEVRANLIVMGRFGLHHRRRRMGSVASRVLDTTTCPTFVVGMVDDTPEPRDQCPDCVQVRAESDGEVWFCPAHSAPDRVSMATTLLGGGSLTGGTLMW
jgi:nucleotide-binding universal stress UspA family protein